MKIKPLLIAGLLVTAGAWTLSAQTPAQRNKPADRSAKQAPPVTPKPGVVNALNKEEKTVAWTLSDMPTALQAPIRSKVGNGILLGIDKIVPPDKSVVSEAGYYRVVYKDAHTTYQMRVSPTGEILETTPEAGAPDNR